MYQILDTLKVMRSTGLFAVVLWAQLGYATVVVGIPLLLGIALAWWTTRTRGAAANDRPRRARTARLIGLGVGALVGVLTVFAAQAFLAPIAVVAGYLVGVLTGELRNPPEPTGTVRVASLQPRTVRRYVPRWAALVALGAAAVTVFAPAILAAIPTARYGPWHPIPDDPRITLPGAALAWPPVIDWFPLAVVALGALAVGALLIQRVLRLPADPSGGREAGRRDAVRTITAAVVGVELVALGALTLFASAGLAVPEPVGGGAYLASRVMIWTGLALVGTGIVLWLALSTWRRRPLIPDPAAWK
jgi:hypothetical protein